MPIKNFSYLCIVFQENVHLKFVFGRGHLIEVESILTDKKYDDEKIILFGAESAGVCRMP